MNIEQKVLKAVLLLRKLGNKSQSKEKQIKEVGMWMRYGMEEAELDEWIDEMKRQLSGEEENEIDELVENEWDWNEDEWEWHEDAFYGP